MPAFLISVYKKERFFLNDLTDDSRFYFGSLLEAENYVGDDRLSEIAWPG